MKQILINTLNRANKNDLKHGLSWYNDARVFCKQVSELYNVPLYKVVGVLAALSPRNKWNRNKIDCINVIKHGYNATVCTFNSNKEKACKILAARSLEHCVKLLNGIKVQSFFSNIYYKDCQLVTVDVWAMRAIGYNGNLTPKKYREIESIYQTVARDFGMLPKQLQAVAWSTIREGAH